MSVLTLLFTLALLPFILVRLLRWLAWTQQKEYRPDRLWQFALSEEGLSELTRLLPERADFTRTGLKRPVPTIRSAGTAFLSLALLGYVLTAGYTQGWWWAAPAVYVLIPLFPGIVSFVLEIFKTLLSTVLLFAAHKKLATHKPLVYGITGSYGKTTTRHLCAHVLSQQYTLFTPPKSHNTPVSIAWSILKNYTKEEIIFLEFAAYKKGEIKRLAHWFEPEVSVVTGLTAQHLALFGSIDNIIAAKGELVQATKLTGCVFYNGNDPGALKIVQEDKSKKAIPYSGPKSAVILSRARLDEKGRLSFMWRDKPIQTHLVGLHTLEGVQAAIALAEYAQIPDTKIRSALESFLPTDNYIQVYPHSKQGFLIINDGGTSNPRGFLAALEVLQHFKTAGKNTLLITGGILDAGDDSDELHTKLAKRAKQIADVVLYTGIDGRHVFKEVFAAAMTDHDSTIQTILDKLNENDAVLIEGHVPSWLMKQLTRHP